MEVVESRPSHRKRTVTSAAMPSTLVMNWTLHWRHASGGPNTPDAGDHHAGPQMVFGLLHNSRPGCVLRISSSEELWNRGFPD